MRRVRRAPPTWKISEKSALKLSLSFFALALVISSREKSKTSSERSFKMIMLFSHSVSFVFDALTMSEMNDGQLCGHSCLTTCTRMTLSLLVKRRCSL